MLMLRASRPRSLSYNTITVLSLARPQDPPRNKCCRFLLALALTILSHPRASAGVRQSRETGIRCSCRTTRYMGRVDRQ